MESENITTLPKNTTASVGVFVRIENLLHLFEQAMVKVDPITC
jgi:hypothetical protein